MQLKHSFDDENLRSLKLELDKDESILKFNDFLYNENEINDKNKNEDSNISNLNHKKIKYKNSLDDEFIQNKKYNYLQNNLFDNYYEDESFSDKFSMKKMFSSTNTNCTESKSDIDHLSPFSKKIMKNDIKKRNYKIGLKSLSLKIKEIVKIKSITTYKEVSDLIIEDLKNLKNIIFEKEKLNVKRRVYDALNVLISLGVINKANKTISYNTIFCNNNFKDNDLNYVKYFNYKKLIKEKIKIIDSLKKLKNNRKLELNKIKDLIYRNQRTNNKKLTSIPKIMVNFFTDENVLKIKKEETLSILSKLPVKIKYYFDIWKYIYINKKRQNK